MSFEIKVSNVGPIVVWNGAAYTLQDHIDLLDLLDEHPEFLDEIKAHIVQYTKETMADVVDGLENNMFYNHQRAYSYLQAISAYGGFANQSVPEHRMRTQTLL